MPWGGFSLHLADSGRAVTCCYQAVTLRILAQGILSVIEIFHQLTIRQHQGTFPAPRSFHRGLRLVEHALRMPGRPVPPPRTSSQPFLSQSRRERIGVPERSTTSL